MNAEYTGKKIAELRKKKDMTQKELAEKLHVTDKAVSKWERGVNFPDLGLMEELAKTLDVTPSVLLGLENSSKEEIVTSFAEISNQQAKEASQDIQRIGWIYLLVGVCLFILMHFFNLELQRGGLFYETRGLLWMVYGLIAVAVIGAIYILRKYKAIVKFELMDSVLAEVLVVDVVAFFAISLFTGRNPNYVVTGVMIGIGVVCLQLLFYRVMKPQLIKALPCICFICWFCWGLLLKLAEPTWAKDNVWDIVVIYILPVLIGMITWLICRGRDVEKEKLLPGIKLLAIVGGTGVIFVTLFAQDLLAKTYVNVFHRHLEAYAENLLSTCEDTVSDHYGFWEVTCYPEKELVEFHTGGAGLVFNSTYLGFYYSPDDSHKVFQGAEVPLHINENLAEWFGEGDNWGRSTRLLEKWFWFEANF